FPHPKFIVCTNLACDAAQKSFYIYARKFNIEENFYLIDVPYSKNKKTVNYLANQLKEISEDISKKLGEKIDMQRLAETIQYSNSFRKWVTKVNTLRKELIYYPPNFNGLNFILPFHAFAGTKDNIILYQKMYLELSKYLRMQKKKDKIEKQAKGNKKNRELGKQIENITDSKRPVRRILWLHLKPYYKNDIFSILEKENCKVVFEEINQVYWPPLDPQNPFESLAEKMLSHFLNGSIENRLNKILNMIKEYRIDGTILFSHWGCRQNNGASRIIKDVLKDQGQPILILDSDCVDQSNFPQGQLKTRLQGFIEILNSNSK
ncbi:MAG: 2-hydroxyacyl-CoA dehydratase, partial [Actinobacteria bacterium]|nr:2-hydroxyacyl-CoA dehydratase [Actinomycetota bacterium]